MSKYRVISGPNTRKYGPEMTSYLDTFHAVNHSWYFEAQYLYFQQDFVTTLQSLFRSTLLVVKSR